MEKIYHMHTSSNSWSESSWTDTDYYLCDNEEEYQQKIKEAKAIVDDYQEKQGEIYGSWRFQISDEKPVHAREYYYGHAWQGQNFDAVGVCLERHYERSNHYEYFLKPNSITNQTKPVFEFSEYAS